MTTFAQNYLLKQGWSQGKGLGKNENGNVDPIKVYKRFDKTGVGHDVSKEYTNHWWEQGFQAAANNIKVNDTEKDVTVKSKTKKKKVKKNSLHLGKFMKSTSLLKDGIVHTPTQNETQFIQPDKEVSSLPKIVQLTDEELFKACGGRTAHKGARHGLKMSAKLQRIKCQDENQAGKVTKKHKKAKKVKSTQS